MKRGCRSSQRWISGVWWVDELSTTTWTPRSSGTLRLIRFKNRSELEGAVAFGHVGNDLARRNVEGRVEIGGAASHRVVGASFG